MYSKFGRQSKCLFRILREKASILQGQSSQRTQAPVALHRKLLSPEAVLKLVEASPVRQREPAKPKNSSSFLSQSRQNFYKVHGHRPQGPTRERYCIDSSLVTKRVSSPSLQQRPRTASARTCSPPPVDRPLSPEKPRRVLRGFFIGRSNARVCLCRCRMPP